MTPSPSSERLQKITELEPSALAGNPEAQFKLGELHDDPGNRGAVEDYRQALAWYEKAAAQGHERAANHAGYLLLNGLGGEVDHLRAMRWLRPLAEQGNRWAREQIADSHWRGQGTPRNEAEAVRWYKLAADSGSGEAMFRLGYAYANGLGVERDPAEAVRWFLLADGEENGSARACLGALYFYGAGVDRDYGQAADWFRKAIASPKGNTWAPYMLGVMAENGFGGPRDMAKAAAFYRKAAAGPNGYYEARIRCRLLEGAGGQDPGEADLLPLAADAQGGRPLSQFLLGLVLAEGRGLAKNETEALQWLVLAAPELPAAAQARDALQDRLPAEAIREAQAGAAQRRRQLAGKPVRMF